MEERHRSRDKFYVAYGWKSGSYIGLVTGWMSKLGDVEVYGVKVPVNYPCMK